MAALILEGGTFRPMFSSGVMDALLENDINFDYVIGVSAGITDGVSYVSKQIGRNYDIFMKYRLDKRYVGLNNMFSDKSIFGIKFMFEELPKKWLPFDWDTFHENPAIVRVGVTNANTGEAEYLDGKLLDTESTMLKATCAQPFIFPEVVIDGTPYYDGGIADSIPIQKAIDDGNEKFLIVLTRPKGYVKKQSKKMILAAKAISKKYPALKEPLINRYKVYNEQVALCEELEKSGKAIILRPSKEVMIASLEKDLDKADKIFKYGYNLANENIEKIKALFS